MPTDTTMPPVRDLLALLVEQGKDHALILTDADGLVVGWLCGAETILGYRADEIVRHSLSRLFTPEDRELGLDAHEFEVARKDGKAEDDRWMVRKDGSRFWASGYLTCLRDADGVTVGFGKMLRDRTDVRAQVESLENRAEALRRAGEKTTAFLGTLAHELRNPLAPLATAAQLVRLANAGNPEMLQTADMIGRQVAVLRRLVDDLMDVARVGAGKVRLSCRAVSLQDACERAAEAVRPSADGRGQTLDVLVPPNLIEFDADPDRLHQVLINLLTNAVKYTPHEGSIWLKATVEGTDAVFRVEDTGVGIAPDMLPQIFDLFTQEDTSLSRSEGGLGIGLAVVKDLVALHGGVVQVRSEGKGKGSNFAVRLPVRQPPPLAAAK